MFKKLIPHLLLALVVFILTIGQQYLFFGFKNYPIYWYPFSKLLIVFLFFFAATFIQNSKSRFFFLGFVIFLNMGQMMHMSYFGTQILPAEYYLLFTQMGEIQGTLKEELHHILIPILFTIIPVLALYFAHLKIKLHYQFKFLTALFILYLIYNPARTYVTGNTWGRQPSTRELSGMNAYLTLSYFLGKILPLKISKVGAQTSINSSLKLKIEKAFASKWDKIILIAGESLTPHHMQLFGYPKETTPYLNSMQGNRFFYTQGLSSGVSTDISLSFFFNLTFGSSGAMKASKGEHCLFKLAKNQNFGTHFLSVQSEEQLRYITPYLCSSFLDEYQSLEQIDPSNKDPNAAEDKKLFPRLENLLKISGPQFIVLNQRGSHAPWNLRYSAEANKFKGEDYPDKRIADYDNSVFQFDLFWKDLDQILKQSKEKILVIYFSDHGEALGEEGRWGHGGLYNHAFEIPVIITAYNQDLPKETFSLPNHLTHYNLGLYLIEAMGMISNQSSSQRVNDFVIFGNDIDGLAGQAIINWQASGGYDFKISI
ncbi:MAG: phosphoethanolamine transferase [Bacteriovoracaceae bacterium]